MDQGWTTQLSPFWIPTQQKHGQEETPWLKPSIWSRELKQEPVFLLCSLLTFILSPGLTFSKSFYILALVGIWVINPYLNQSGDLLKLCELWKIRILKINAYTLQNWVLRAGGLQGAMEISAWSALSSMGHLAQGEESARSRIGQLFLRVAFLIGKSRTCWSLTFEEPRSKIGLLLYYLFWGIFLSLVTY